MSYLQSFRHALFRRSFRQVFIREPRREDRITKLNTNERVQHRFYDQVHYPVWYMQPVWWWFENLVHPFWVKYCYPDKIEVCKQRGIALQDLMNTYFTGKITQVEFNVAVMGSFDDWLARHLRLGRARAYMDHMCWTMPEWVNEENADFFVYTNEEFPFHDHKFTMYSEMTPRPNPQPHMFAKNPLIRIAKLFRHGTRLTYNETPFPSYHRYGSHYTEDQIREHIHSWDGDYVEKPFHLNCEIPEEKEKFESELAWYSKHTPEIYSLWDGNYPTPSDYGHVPGTKFDDDGFPLDGRTFDELTQIPGKGESYQRYLEAKRDSRAMGDYFEWSIEQGKDELADKVQRLADKHGISLPEIDNIKLPSSQGQKKVEA